MELALESIRVEVGLKSVSQAARYAVQVGLNKLTDMDAAIRKAAFVEGEMAGRAAFKKRLAALFAEGVDDE
jgi:hypothetical protein